MTAALRLLQDVRPTPEPRLWIPIPPVAGGLAGCALYKEAA